MRSRRVEKLAWWMLRRRGVRRVALCQLFLSSLLVDKVSSDCGQTNRPCIMMEQWRCIGLWYYQVCRHTPHIRFARRHHAGTTQASRRHHAGITQASRRHHAGITQASAYTTQAPRRHHAAPDVLYTSYTNQILHNHYHNKMSLV